MTQNKRFFLLTGLMTVFVILVIHFSSQKAAGAPQVFISTPATTSALTDFGFVIGTTTPLSAFGSTTLAVYGSTTIQTRINTLHAFRVINAASTTVFSVDTVNASTTVAGQLNAQTLTVTSCEGCTGLTGGSANTLAFWTSATAIGATSSPTVGYITATSSTASIFTGGVTITCTGCLTDANVVDTITLTNITQITNRAISDTTGTLAVGRGGTGLTTFAAGDVVYASALDTLAGLTAGASSTVLTINASGLPVWTAQPSLVTLATRGLFSAFGNITATSTIDFSGGLFKLVASTSLTTLTTGEMGIDRTSGQLRFFDGSNTQVIVATSSFGFNVASSSLAAYNSLGGSAATSTIYKRGFFDDVTITEVSCRSRSTTTVPNVIIQLGDGTASATPIAFCNDAGQVISLTAGNTWTPNENILISLGSATGTVPDQIYVDIRYKFDAN